MSGTYGFLADDLTGASDVLAQAHAHGLSAMLVLDPDRLGAGADVVGVAGPARSLQGDALDAEVNAGFTALGRLDLDVLLYKVCSTFDSSPTVGSIGRALELLAEHHPGHGPVPVVPAQPAFGRHTAFSQHFGAYAGEVHRLDRHPVMAVHPSTPMVEADLRYVLAAQLGDGTVPPGLHLTAHADGDFRARWDDLRRGRGHAFVVDAVDETHMDAAAEALLASAPDGGPAVVVGSGGIMSALARRRTGRPADVATTTRSSGPTLVVSASASLTTAGQIADAVDAGWTEIRLDPGDGDDGAAADAVGQALAAGRDVVAHTAAGPQDPRLATGLPADLVGSSIGRLAGRMVAAGLTRDVVVCGGDTSSHALAALDVHELRVAELFVTAGPICVADDDSAVAGCRLLLKGGQVGHPSLFRSFAGQPTERH